MLTDYILLALKNLKHRGLRSWLTMLGIFIGIAAVVSLISLGNALDMAITGQFGTLSSGILTIQNTGTGFGPPGSTAIKKLTEHDLKIIESTQGAKSVISRIIRIVEVEYNKISKFRYIGSMPLNQDEIKLINEELNVKPESGRLLTTADRGKVVLGNDFLDNSFEKKIRVGVNIKIQGENFEVIGILKKASTFTINSVILMPEDDLKRLLKIGDEIDLIVVKVDNKDNIDQIAKDIERKLRKDRDEKLGEEDFSVQTPIQALQAVSTVLNIINLIITGIAAISLLVGGIGIANTMYTSVLERTKEIGVMKSIGARNRDILLIFLIESAFLGLVGGIVGALMGLALAFIAATGASSALGIDFKVTLSLPFLLSAISFSLLIGVVSGILPAFQASKLNPVEALRR